MSAVSNIKIGIIGGSGLNKSVFFKLEKEETVTTPFGSPSDSLQHGEISGVPCVILLRHGRQHTIPPTHVPHRANLYALRRAGCTHVLAATACGSLRERMAPGHFVAIHSFIDRTTQRVQTFYDGSCDEFKGICHLPMTKPFCGRTRSILATACEKAGVTVHKEGVMVTIEGPRFSSVAESKMFQAWGGDVINMTTCPEVVLAGELGLCYASVAMVTDYDCWRGDGEEVDVSRVLAAMRRNAENAVQVLRSAVELISAQDWSRTVGERRRAAANSVMLPH